MTNRPEDVLARTKAFLAHYQTDDKGLISSLRAAYDIFYKVFGRNYGGIRNFVNFLQIVKDEFMKIGEMLPTMGDDDGTGTLDTEFIAELNREIARYERLERRRG